MELIWHENLDKTNWSTFAILYWRNLDLSINTDWNFGFNKLAMEWKTFTVAILSLPNTYFILYSFSVTAFVHMNAFTAKDTSTVKLTQNLSLFCTVLLILDPSVIFYKQYYEPSLIHDFLYDTANCSTNLAAI